MTPGSWADMRRAAVVVGLLLAVALAGCIGPIDLFGEGTPTATPPPGYSEAGVENVTRALQVDERARNATESYHVTYYAGLSLASSQVLERDVAGGRAYATYTTAGSYQRAAYRTPIGITTRASGRGSPTVMFFAGGTAEGSAAAQPLSVPGWTFEYLLPTLTYSNASRVTIDGETHFQYRVTGVDAENPILNDGLNLTDGNLRVDPEGRIRNVTLWVESPAEDSAQRRLLTYRVTEIGETTVETPAWIDTVPRVTGESLEGGHVIRLRNHGPGTIPPETSVAPGRYVNAPEIGEPIAPNESIYVSLQPGAERKRVVLSNSPPPDDRVGAHFRTMRDRFNDPEGMVSFTVSIRGGHRAKILVDLDE